MSTPWNQLTSEERVELILLSWRYTLPTLGCILSLWLMLLPLSLPELLMPQWGLLGILYWATHRHGLMPAGAAFLVGLVQDLWLGQPLGLNAGLLALTAFLLASQSHVYASRPFHFGWLLAVPIIVLYQLATTGLLIVTGGTAVIPGLVVQALTTLIAYPVAIWGHARLRRKLVDSVLLASASRW